MSFKYYKTTYIIIIILILTTILDFGIEDFLIPLLLKIHLSFLRIPSNAAIIGGILVFYDNILWRLPVFNLLVNVPNMNGRYQGKIHFELNELPKSKNCVVEVHQTSSRIHLRFFFNNENEQKTTSRSFIEEIEKENDGNYAIYLFYLNEGSKKDGILDCHEGVNKLRFLPKKNENPAKLTGYYFTNRQKQTRGEVEVTFISKDKKGEF